MSEADTKVRQCQACGEDCTGKPRIKDKKGRYLHKACYEKAKQRTGNSVVGTAADPTDPVPVATRPFAMAEFLEDSFKLVAQACPNCSHSMPEGTLLCVHCGYNFHSGKTLKTIARVEETPKGERAGSSANAEMSAFLTPPVVSMLYAVSMIGAAFATSGKESFMLVLLVAILATATMNLVAIVATFMDSIVRGILALFVPFYQLIWLLTMCESAWIRWLTLTTATVWLVIAVGFGFSGLMEAGPTP